MKHSEQSTYVATNLCKCGDVNYICQSLLVVSQDFVLT